LSSRNRRTTDSAKGQKRGIEVNILILVATIILIILTVIFVGNANVNTAVLTKLVIIEMIGIVMLITLFLNHILRTED
jgi:uncharacterized membrane protein